MIALVLLLYLSRRQVHLAGADVEKPVGGSFWAGVKELWKRPFLRYMAVLMVLGDGIGTLAYALMTDYTKAHIHDKVARTVFYNDIDLAANIIVAVLQLSITPLILMLRGAAWALVIPALINVGLLLMIFFGGEVNVPVFGVGIPLLAIMIVTTPRLCLWHDQAGRSTRCIPACHAKRVTRARTLWRPPFGDLATCW